MEKDIDFCCVCAKEGSSVSFYEEFRLYLCNYHYEKCKEHGSIYLYQRNAVIRIEEELGYAIILIQKTKTSHEDYMFDERIYEVLIDVESVEKIENYKWFIRGDYIVADASLKKKFNSVILSRFLLNCSDLDMCVDHINGDTFDNRKENLRIVTTSQNIMNSKVAKNNTTGVTGVVRTKSGKYLAQIGINRNTKYLGTFDTIKEAKNARIEAENKYFGEYSYRNSRKNKI